MRYCACYSIWWQYLQNQITSGVKIVTKQLRHVKGLCLDTTVCANSSELSGKYTLREHCTASILHSICCVFIYYEIACCYIGGHNLPVFICSVFCQNLLGKFSGLRDCIIHDFVTIWIKMDTINSNERKKRPVCHFGGSCGCVLEHHVHCGQTMNQ